MRYALTVVVGLAIAACGATNAKRSGESCVASSECDKALLCNQVHVCAGMGSPDAGSTPGVDAPISHADGPKPIDAFVPKDAPLDAFVPLD